MIARLLTNPSHLRHASTRNYAKRPVIRWQCNGGIAKSSYLLTYIDNCGIVTSRLFMLSGGAENAEPENGGLENAVLEIADLEDEGPHTNGWPVRNSECIKD